MKKISLKKIATTLALSFCIVGGASTAGAMSYEDDFKLALETVLKRMETSYIKGLNENRKYAYDRPFKIVSINSKNVKLSGNNNKQMGPERNSPSSLGVTFDPQGKINGDITSICLLHFQYDKLVEHLRGFESSLPKTDIVYYLAAHEFGHCVEAHQRSLGTKIPDLAYSNGGELEIAQRELFADKFAVAFFLINGKDDIAERIVNFNNIVVDDGYHRHHDELVEYSKSVKKLLDKMKQDYGSVKEQFSSMLDVFEVARSFPSKRKS